ncbi:flavodoxin [Paludibacter jiangxiensis]|uniref:Flavodoxin n=1 Tax=Paludibacter jiangxiensis TaxID=681398 RepID=A0A171ANL0_9BACT|nr:flavodoxin [Paludibacter jiangxiensis]GAT64036.1 flavodoxin [Paludibacter jiangxiensis]
MEEKTLIAYYSRRGQNYVNGKITNLPVGNTEVVAKQIQAIIGGDLFYINTIKPYPVDYMETTDVAKVELRQNERPELTETVKNMDDYDTIYLGYPNWWGAFPMAVCTFLESYNFTGKTIIPFCTHEGSGMCGERDIKRLCPNAIVLPGIAIRGGVVADSDNIVQSWLKSQK